jgi:hypothetical protein
MRLQNAHFTLGMDKQAAPMPTSQIQYPKYINPTPASLNEEKMQDLRSIHKFCL